MLQMSMFYSSKKVKVNKLDKNLTNYKPPFNVYYNFKQWYFNSHNQIQALLNILN